MCLKQLFIHGNLMCEVGQKKRSKFKQFSTIFPNPMSTLYVCMSLLYKGQTWANVIGKTQLGKVHALPQ